MSSLKVAVVTNDRVSAKDFLGVLTRNGVRVKVLGRGSSTVLDSETGETFKIGNTSVLSVRDEDYKRVRLYSRVCGVHAFLLTEREENDRRSQHEG